MKKNFYVSDMFSSEIYGNCLAESLSARVAGRIGVGMEAENRNYNGFSLNSYEENVREEPSYGFRNLASIPPVIGLMLLAIYVEAPLRYVHKAVRR